MSWNGSSTAGASPSMQQGKGAKTQHSASCFNSKALFAGLIVVVLGGFALYWFVGRGKDVPSSVESCASRGGSIPTVTPAAAPRAEEESAPKPDYSAIKAKMKKMTPDQRDVVREEMLKKVTIDLRPSTNQVFKTGTEQIMSWIFNTTPGDLPPPLPGIPDVEYLHMTEILISENTIFENDSDEVAAAKENVMNAKKELKDYIKKGGDPEEFFVYYRGQLTQAFQERSLARESVMKTLREDPDLTLDYLKEVNARLAEKGIKKITLNPKQLQHFGITPPSEQE